MKIYLKNSYEKGHYQSINNFAQNTTIPDSGTLWIMLHQGFLRVGYSEKVGVSTELNNFKYDKDQYNLKKLTFS